MTYEQRTALVGMHDLPLFERQTYKDFVDIMEMEVAAGGYTITTTYGLANTLEAVRREPFGLYIVEINLGQPKVPTSEPLQQVLAAARVHHPNVRVIGITGTDALAKEAKNIEGVIVLPKPCDNLFEVVQSLSR